MENGPNPAKEKKLETNFSSTYGPLLRRKLLEKLIKKK